MVKNIDHAMTIGEKLDGNPIGSSRRLTKPSSQNEEKFRPMRRLIPREEFRQRCGSSFGIIPSITLHPSGFRTYKWCWWTASEWKV
jgi:hypothetical protein